MPTRNFRELLEAMPADRQRKIEKRFQKSLEAMPLDQLRKAQEMTQLQLAEILGVSQGEVSRLSTGPTSVSAHWLNISKLWAAGSRSERCSKIERCGSRSSRNSQATSVTCRSCGRWKPILAQRRYPAWRSTPSDCGGGPMSTLPSVVHPIPALARSGPRFNSHSSRHGSTQRILTVVPATEP